MMIIFFLALSLAPPTPATTPSGPAAVTTTPSQTPAPGEAELAQLHALFEQSCGQRAYGSYDQVCEALGDQIKAAQRQADRAARRPPAKADGRTNP